MKNPLFGMMGSLDRYYGIYFYFLCKFCGKNNGCKYQILRKLMF
jgi:hypothetical protein